MATVWLWPHVLHLRQVPDRGDPAFSHEIDYLYFSTRHWAGLLSGYSGFIAPDAGLAADLALFPSPASIAGLRGRGATHLVYDCAFERSVERCDRNLARLAADPQLQRLAAGRWQGAIVRSYRLR